MSGPSHVGMRDFSEARRGLFLSASFPVPGVGPVNTAASMSSRLTSVRALPPATFGGLDGLSAVYGWAHMQAVLGLETSFSFALQDGTKEDVLERGRVAPRER